MIYNGENQAPKPASGVRAHVPAGGGQWSWVPPRANCKAEGTRGCGEHRAHAPSQWKKAT